MLCIRGSNASGGNDDKDGMEKWKRKVQAIFLFSFFLLKGEIINFAQQTNQSDFIVLSFDYVPAFDCTQS